MHKLRLGFMLIYDSHKLLSVPADVLFPAGPPCCMQTLHAAGTAALQHLNLHPLLYPPAGTQPLLEQSLCPEQRHHPCYGHPWACFMLPLLPN